MALGLHLHLLVLLPSPSSPPHPQPPTRNLKFYCRCSSSRREVAINSAAAVLFTALPSYVSGSSFAASAEESGSPDSKSSGTTSSSSSAKNPVLRGIANTTSWFQFFGNGFSLRVPPSFDDIMEPEEYNSGLTYYGDKVKPKTFAAQFASPDRSEVLSVVIRPSNQLKITFLEAKDITDLGTLKEASKFFVPGGAQLYSGRTIKVKEDENIRTYYFYEFGINTQHVALVAVVNSGKTYIAGATAPQSKWEEDGVKLRSAAISLSVS